MVAITPTQPSTDFAFGVDVLRDVLADMKAAAPELAGRLDRAAGILVTRSIIPCELGGWRVESERVAGEYYWVTQHGATWCCCCLDYQRHMATGQPCKHILCIRLLLAALDYTGPDDPAPVLLWPNYPTDRPIPYTLTAKAHALLDRAA